ncbi:hypothetical protein BT69DRAFT_1324727 [Atractiella rhizophila]|nr:hypothetical protein BT69DRAFT_1324727 [Atractiella rhizophila]
MNVSPRGRNPAFDFPYQIYIVIIGLRKKNMGSYERQTLFISVELTTGPSCPDVLLVLCCCIATNCAMSALHEHLRTFYYDKTLPETYEGGLNGNGWKDENQTVFSVFKKMDGNETRSIVMERAQGEEFRDEMAESRQSIQKVEVLFCTKSLLQKKTDGESANPS